MSYTFLIASENWLCIQVWPAIDSNLRSAKVFRSCCWMRSATSYTSRWERRGCFRSGGTSNVNSAVGMDESAFGDAV